MEEKLISIEELIKRAKSLGVDFGKGDPKNRLRYYTKLGLIPHAKRKCFQSRFPSGAYPESVLKTLLKIDKELKKGKTIQEIKKEFEKEKILKEREILPQKEFVLPKSKFLPVKKIIALALLPLILFMLTATQEIKPKEFLSSLLAVLQEKFKLAQISSSPPFPSPETSSLSLEPYLTINAQTLVRPSLKAEESLEAPNFLLLSGEFKGSITASLTGDRTYTLPDESGQICLSSGNCVRLLGEVQTPGGETARLAKFTGPNRISNSSIVDLFSGVLITIDEKGNIGIATETPRARLEVVGDSIFVGDIEVEGGIEATGDICTKLEGGKCLSELLSYYGGWGGGGGAAGVGGSGSPTYLAMWTSSDILGDSLLHQSGETLYLPGNFEITGSLKVSTTSLPQLLLEYGNLNYLKFEIEENTTTISASSTLYINSLTGQIIASDATLTATSFVASDATVRSIGEYVFREAIPICKYPVPAQTESTNFVQISRYFSSGETISSISKLKGSQRKYAFLINMADDIPTNSSSTWRVYRPSANATYTSFTIQGNAMTSLEEGKPILTDFMNLPDDDWRLEVSVPAGRKLRVFNILLLVFDQVL